MSLVILTLDYYDGRKSKASKPVELESVGLYLRMEMSHKDVASMTITKYIPLEKMVEKMVEDDNIFLKKDVDEPGK